MNDKLQIENLNKKNTCIWLYHRFNTLRILSIIESCCYVQIAFAATESERIPNKTILC